MSAASTLSAVPGRIRWSHPCLRDRPDVATRLEAAVQGERTVHEVRANALTGRVLVRFDPGTSIASIEAVLVAAIAPYVPAGAPEQGPRRSALGRAVMAGTVAAAVTGVLGPGGALTAAALTATGWFVVRDLRERTAPGGPAPALRERVGKLLRAHRRRAATAAIIDATAGVISAVRFVTVGVAVNAAFSGAPLVVGPVVLAPGATIVVMLAATGVTIVLRAWLKHRGRIVWAKAGAGVRHDLRMEVLAHMQRLELDTLQRAGAQQLLQIVNDDVNRLDELWSGLWGAIEVTTSSVVLALGVLILAPELLWVALLPVPVVVIARLLYPRMRAGHQAVRREGGRLARELRVGIDGITTIKSFTAEEAERDRVATRSLAYAGAEVESGAARSLFPLVLEGIVLMASSVVYVSGDDLGLAAMLPFGTVVTVAQLISFAMYSVAQLPMRIDEIERGLAAVDRIVAFLAVSPPPDAAATPDAPVLRGDLSYDGVSFAYPPSRTPLFDGLTMHFRAGQVTAVVGLTGSGKSTLLNLLLRFWEPSSGRITIGGRDIRDVPRQLLRRSVTVVSQDVSLLARTIRDNVVLGRPDAAPEALDHALSLAQADFVGRLAAGLSTPVGDRGETLSGGERQRVAIARALLKEAPIVVFDEATAHLDCTTERDLWAAILPEMRGRTTVLITHRLAGVRHADFIYVLEGGRVVGAGTHDELLAQPGRYRSLWESQAPEPAHGRPPLADALAADGPGR